MCQIAYQPPCRACSAKRLPHALLLALLSQELYVKHSFCWFSQSLPDTSGHGSSTEQYLLNEQPPFPGAPGSYICVSCHMLRGRLRQALDKMGVRQPQQCQSLSGPQAAAFSALHVTRSLCIVMLKVFPLDLSQGCISGSFATQLAAAIKMKDIPYPYILQHQGWQQQATAEIAAIRAATNAHPA